MKTPLFLMASVLTTGLAALLAGCGDDASKPYCDSWCEMALSVELEQLENEGCELTDDEEELVTDCEEICQSIAFDLPEPGQVEACVECVYGEVGGSPSWQQFQDALNGPCEERCFEQSMIDFYFEFWDDWNYEDYDYECD